MSLSLTIKRANLSLWDLNKVRQNEGASGLWILELPSRVKVGCSHYGLFECIPPEVDP